MDLDRAMVSPGSVFATPLEVCNSPGSVFATPLEVGNSPGLTQEQKIEILHRWEYDARELQVAAEENMAGGANDVSLGDILAALHQLGASAGASHSTKQ